MNNEPAQEREQWHGDEFSYQSWYGMVTDYLVSSPDNSLRLIVNDKATQAEAIAYFNSLEAAAHNAQPSAVDVSPVVSLLESALSYWDRREVCMSYIKDALAAARIQQPSAVDHTHVWFAVDVEERRIRLTAFPALCAIAICGECGTTYFSLMHREQPSAAEAKAALADEVLNFDRTVWTDGGAHEECAFCGVPQKYELINYHSVALPLEHKAACPRARWLALPTTPEQHDE